MKAFTALLALSLVASSLATPCTDICNGSCDLVQQTIGLVFPEVAIYVAPNIETCKETCAAMCTCTDACGIRCGTPFQACVAEANSMFNPLAVLSCQIKYAVCSMPCNLQCSTTIVSGIMQQIQSVFDTFTQSVSAIINQFIGSPTTPAP